MKTTTTDDYFRSHGFPHPDRFRDLAAALRAEARDARDAAARARDVGDTHRAAMLGGKATASTDAARMLATILRGDSLHPRRYSSARTRARAFRHRRDLRRAAT